MGLSEEVERQALRALDLDRALYGSPAVAAVMGQQVEMERLLGPTYSYCAYHDVVQQLREATELQDRAFNPLGLSAVELEALKLREQIQDRKNQVLKLRMVNEEAAALRQFLADKEAARLEHDRIQMFPDHSTFAFPTARAIEMPDFSRFVQPTVEPRRRVRGRKALPQVVAAPPATTRWQRFTAFVHREEQERGTLWRFIGYIVIAVLTAIGILLTL